MACFVGEDIVELAKDMILSSEELTTGKVAIYARFADESEESESLELATNGPGPKSPDKILIALIRKKAKGRK